VKPSRTESLLAGELRTLIAELGKGGGLQNGSVYDTAQVARLALSTEEARNAVEWLLRKQNAKDGGWDNPKVPMARDTPTLAAVLALKVRGGGDARVGEAIDKGLAFLRNQQSIWKWTEPPDDLLVGVELTLPKLLDEAKALLGDKIKEDVLEQYSALRKLGEKRKAKLHKMFLGKMITSGTPPVHSWEGWGTEPEPELLDESGGVGLSPAATAAWLDLAVKANKPELNDSIRRAREYLKKAEEGTHEVDRGPGVVPPSWPIDLMEIQWGLYALLCAGLLNDPRFKDVVEPHLNTLKKAFRAEKRGIGFTEHFMSDGDCTAVTVALLTAAKWDVADKELESTLEKYKRDGHFETYPYESNASLTTTAHAVTALRVLEESKKSEKIEEIMSPWLEAMVGKMDTGGLWLKDKWQTSWLYVTAHVMHAIKDANKLSQSIQTLLGKQNSKDGGWGAGEHSTPVETAFLVPVLLELRKEMKDEKMILEFDKALLRAKSYLERNHPPVDREPMWIAKALYCPFRMDRAFELSAMLALEDAFPTATSGPAAS
jgi:hypothetical protein